MNGLKTLEQFYCKLAVWIMEVSFLKCREVPGYSMDMKGNLSKHRLSNYVYLSKEAGASYRCRLFMSWKEEGTSYKTVCKNRE